MKRPEVWFLATAAAVILAAVSVLAQNGPSSDESQVKQGFEIAPVPLHVQRMNRALVGLGSYLVNAVGGCNDCHTCPSYAAGLEHNPFIGGDGEINATNYLAGGVAFGPFISKNLTPDDQGRPAGLTFDEFHSVLRTGIDPDTGELLQVMPWPLFRNMTDRDILAIYTYLSTIPQAEPGVCQGAGDATFPPPPSE